MFHAWLYIVLFLHQTTTAYANQRNSYSCISYYSYIKPQPSGYQRPKCLVVYRTIPTSNHNTSFNFAIIPKLYIVLFLHQTTTYLCQSVSWWCCISYYSYIKPQLIKFNYYEFSVVYRTIPTSNHNFFTLTYDNDQLYIVLFLHQTTTTSPELQNSLRLYIVLFLHQTTTL